jgi:hypothetical protein
MLDLSKEMLESLESNFGAVPYARLENELLSLAAKEKLCQSFITRGNPQPAMFGNVYLDEEGILVVNIVDDDPQLIKEVGEALKGEKYYVKGVVYPWTYLEGTRDIMNAKLKRKENGAILDNFVGFYLDDRDNRIVVELLDVSDDAVAVFKKQVMDSPALVFNKAAGRVVPDINVNCGSGISRYSSGGVASVGYRVKKNSVTNYIITAGHNFTSTGTGAKAYIDGAEVGYCTARVMSNCDAALVRITNSSYTATNILNDSPAYSLGTLVTAATVGATIFKEGIASENTSGTCIATNASTGSITDVIWVENPSGDPMSQPGDSGGVVYSITKTTVGIVLGHLENQNYIGVFSKASNINSALSVSRY